MLDNLIARKVISEISFKVHSLASDALIPMSVPLLEAFLETFFPKVFRCCVVAVALSISAVVSKRFAFRTVFDRDEPEIAWFQIQTLRRMWTNSNVFYQRKTRESEASCGIHPNFISTYNFGHEVWICINMIFRFQIFFCSSLKSLGINLEMTSVELGPPTIQK